MQNIDVDVSAVLKDITDFSPFLNKVFALMYFLCNCPKPIVSLLVSILKNGM